MSCKRNYCTVDDIVETWRPLSEEEINKAKRLISQVSAEIRVTAKRYGRDIENMVLEDQDYALVVQSVTIDTVMRTLNTSTTAEPLTQFSQSAGGYTISGTYSNVGGGTLLLNKDLKRLGLKQQMFTGVDIYGTSGN